MGGVDPASQNESAVAPRKRSYGWYSRISATILNLLRANRSRTGQASKRAACASGNPDGLYVLFNDGADEVILLRWAVLEPAGIGKPGLVRPDSANFPVY